MRSAPEKTYVLITPARNEEACIGNAIESVTCQTLPPLRWIIVSDGSTDRTEEIVEGSVVRYPFITLIKAGGSKNGRDFGSKVKAFNAGYSALTGLDYGFIGNLDADVTLEPDYYERLVKKFVLSPRLGIGGGAVLELVGRRYVEQKNSAESVAGAVQLFRKRCYEDIGGYIPIETGGVDSAAEILARARGWKVETFPELKVFHHRKVSGGRDSLVRADFRYGMTHYALGYHPLFHFMKCLYRAADRPFVVGSLSAFLGYYWALLTGCKRVMPKDAIKYLRREQLSKILPNIVRRPLQKAL